jgi:hypothetical protein
MEKEFSSISEALSTDNICLLCSSLLTLAKHPTYEINENFIYLLNKLNYEYSIKINMKNNFIDICHTTDSINGTCNYVLYSQCYNCNSYIKSFNITIDKTNSQILDVLLNSLTMFIPRNNIIYCIKVCYESNTTELEYYLNNVDISNYGGRLLKIETIPDIKDPHKLLNKLCELQLFI